MAQPPTIPQKGISEPSTLTPERSFSGIEIKADPLSQAMPFTVRKQVQKHPLLGHPPPKSNIKMMVPILLLPILVPRLPLSIFPPNPSPLYPTIPAYHASTTLSMHPLPSLSHPTQQPSRLKIPLSPSILQNSSPSYNRLRPSLQNL
jgi:hypothetical protein